MHSRQQTSLMRDRLLELGMKGHSTSATIELTRHCNGSCDYCYVVDNSAPDLPTARIKEILDKLSDNNILLLNLTGGEPFARPDIMEILYHVVERDFWGTRFFTNATLIKDKHLRFITEHADFFPVMHVSVFSHIPEVNDTYMGIPNGLSRVLEVIPELKNAGITVYISTNMMDFNIDTFEQTRTFFRDRGFSVRTAHGKIVNGDCHGCTQQNTDRLARTTTPDFYSRMLRNMDQTIIDSIATEMRDDGERSPAENLTMCNGVQTNVDIDCQGNIRPCNAFRRLACGSIFDNGSVRELIEKSEVMMHIRSLRRGDIEKCRECRHNNTCGICLGKIHTETGRLDRPLEQFCNFTRAAETLVRERGLWREAVS